MHELALQASVKSRLGCMLLTAKRVMYANACKKWATTKLVTPHRRVGHVVSAKNSAHSLYCSCSRCGSKEQNRAVQLLLCFDVYLSLRLQFIFAVTKLLQQRYTSNSQTRGDNVEEPDYLAADHRRRPSSC